MESRSKESGREPHSPQVDESLYSRQLYVIGHEAMKRMLRSHVLIMGLRGAGLEAAKNLCLAGVRSITLFDNEAVAASDLSTCFYCTERDVGDRRDRSCLYKLKALNTQVAVDVADEVPEDFSGFTAVLLCDAATDSQIRINRRCRRDKVPFITSQISGLFSQVFCDFGDEFITTDENGEPPFTGIIKTVGPDGAIALVDDERHGLEDGDVIETKSEEKQRFTIKVIDLFKFAIVDRGSSDLSGMAYEQVKRSLSLKFKSFEDSLDSPEITGYLDHSDAIHRCFLALPKYVAKEGALPRARNKEDAEKFLELYRLSKKEVEDEGIVREFSYQARGSIAPMASVVGGVVAHEVLKACSAKFRPLQQFMYYSALDALPPNLLEAAGEPDGGEFAEEGRYKSAVALFGKANMGKIHRQRIFQVGAGAIGCEHLKNMVLLGMGKDGEISVTDMDSIERSNLNRQFLFRPGDLFQMKAVVACREAAVLNKDLASALKSYTCRVGQETESVFNDEFFERLDLVTNALDSIEARLYMDNRCIYKEVAMFDAGTLGTKGHTQVVIPHFTENYGNTQDPPEKEIPLCTIRNFPHRPEHAIEWALAEFKNLFNERISEIKNALKNMNGRSEVNEQAAGALSNAQKHLVVNRATSYRDCVHMAAALFESRFNKAAKSLLDAFPLNHVAEDGSPFWAPPKRPPMPIRLDPENPLHLEYVHSTAHLIARNFSIPAEEESETLSVTKEISSSLDPDFDLDLERDSGKEREYPLKKVVAAMGSLNLAEEPFEKDNDANHHMDFIASASNLRCMNYGIHLISRHQAKKIAGRIIPAIATTTAVVSGLVVMETLKYIFSRAALAQEGVPKEEKAGIVGKFKNSYVNLAFPLIACSEPVAPKTDVIGCPKGDRSYTLWDRITFGNDRLVEIINALESDWGMKVITVMHRSNMLYCSFYDRKHFDKNLEKRVDELVFKGEVPKGTTSVKLEVVFEGEDGEDLAVPFVLVSLAK